MRPYIIRQKKKAKKTAISRDIITTVVFAMPYIIVMSAAYFVFHNFWVGLIGGVLVTWWHPYRIIWRMRTNN